MTPLAGPLLVLGAGGFIGSWVTRAALEAGVETIAACLGDTWRLDGLPPGNLERLRVRDGRWDAPDDHPALAAAIGRSASVALLAYTPPPPGADRLEHERSVNRDGSARVARLAGAAGARLAFASSADVYGPWHDEPVSEDTDPSPASAYGIAKLEAEQAVAAACSETISLRIATVFGPGENGPRAIPSFIRALRTGEDPIIHGEGTDVRDYVYVADVARAIFAASVAEAGGAINLGSGVGRSTNEVLAEVARAMNRPAEPRRVPSTREPSRLIVNPATARDRLGWAPHTAFGHGLVTEIAWLRSHLPGGGTDSLR